MPKARSPTSTSSPGNPHENNPNSFSDGHHCPAAAVGLHPTTDGSGIRRSTRGGGRRNPLRPHSGGNRANRAGHLRSSSGKGRAPLFRLRTHYWSRSMELTSYRVFERKPFGAAADTARAVSAQSRRRPAAGGTCAAGGKADWPHRRCAPQLGASPHGVGARQRSVRA